MPRSSVSVKCQSVAKPKRKLSQWNIAMKMATLELRRKNPDLVGKILFQEGAKLARIMISNGQVPAV